MADRLQVFNPIAGFARVPADAVADAFNSLIRDINAALSAIGLSASTPFVTSKQLHLWAAANGSPVYIYTLDNSVPADIANAVNIQWFHGNTMQQGDALYNFVKSTLGFTDPQMITAMTAMQGYTP